MYLMLSVTAFCLPGWQSMRRLCNTAPGIFSAELKEQQTVFSKCQRCKNLADASANTEFAAKRNTVVPASIAMTSTVSFMACM